MSFLVKNDKYFVNPYRITFMETLSDDEHPGLKVHFSGGESVIITKDIDTFLSKVKTYLQMG